MQFTKLDEIRFWSKVDVGRQESCWYWKASQHSFGYGYFRINKHTYLSHKLAKIFFDGEDKKLFVLHSCNNPKCCNPFHLKWGTQQDNINDSILAGTKTNPPRNRTKPPIRYGEENNFSKLTKEKVISIRKDKEQGINVYDIALKHGIAKSTVYQIINYKTWKQI